MKYLSLLLSVIFALSFTGCNTSSVKETEPEAGVVNNTEQLLCDAVYPEMVNDPDSNEYYEEYSRIREENPVDENFINSINNFGYDISSKVFSDYNKNVLLSPVSLYYAVALVGCGAEGETKDEFLNLLGVDSTQYLSEQCSNLFRRMYKDNNSAKLTIADSLWIKNNNFNVLDSYLETAKKDFYSSVYKVDFNSIKTGDLIGDWINKNTNGTLDYRYTPDSNIVMKILNTVYLKAGWADEFQEENTKSDVFYLNNGSTVQCDFMNMSKYYGAMYFGNGYKKSKLSLGQSGYVEFVLPDEVENINDLINDKDKLSEILSNQDKQMAFIDWKVPKFSYKSNLEMLDCLKKMGLNNAFIASKADFSGITDGDIFISGINHCTYIDVDEKGIEASAYTEITCKETSMPEIADKAEMVLDRPFMYAVYSDTGVLLFVGVCYNPVE